MIVLDGKKIADEILSGLTLEKKKPRIAIIMVAPDEPTKVFVGLKEKAIKQVGATATVLTFEENITEAQLQETVHSLNKNVDVDGILVQLPLPEHINENHVLSVINPLKDVDGLTPHNLGNLMLGENTVIPCTVKAIMKLLEGVELAGKHVVVINRSSLIGKPLAMALLQKDATVTICHSKTTNLTEHTKRADIIITAAGQPKLLNAGMVKEGAVVIDAGFAVLQKRVAGDADLSVRDKASIIAPVPGGVGPVTVAMVVQNLFEVSKKFLWYPNRMKVLWLSANRFGYEMLKEAMKALAYVDIVGIITLSESATTVMYDDVEKERWYEFGIPVHRVEKINDAADLIRSINPDLIVEAGWRQIISNEILNIPKKGTVGFHPTLLPQGRGPAPIINSMLEGIKESGVTLFYLCDRVDGGDIIGQAPFTIEDSDYAEDVYRKVIEAGKTLISRYLPLLAKDEAPRIPQDEAHATVFRKRSLEENELDLLLGDAAPEEFYRKIRALSKPYRGAWLELGDKKLVIWRAELK